MTTALVIGAIQGYQWIIILAIVLLLFGGKKIPELMKGVGKGVKAFKEGMNEVDKEINEVDKEINPSKTSTTSTNKTEAEK